MKSYSQNGEDLIISLYFGDYKGTLLSIGENDGETFSNSRRLIEMGWKGVMFEPDKGAYRKLHMLYHNNPDVWCYNLGVSNYCGNGKFYRGNDSLLSTSFNNLASKYPNNSYVADEANFITFAGILSVFEPPYDFISIDAEGEDWNILQQIDLTAVGCKCLCIESGNDAALPGLYTEYCARHGMKRVLKNGENMIFVIPSPE